MNNNYYNKWALFLIGCFSMTQFKLIGFIGISEIVLFFLAPVFVIFDWRVLRRHGFHSIVILSLLCLLGAFVSCFYNNIDFNRAIRGIASPYAIFAIIVCLHHFLYPNIYNIKWLLVGLACSTVISVFIFQPGSGRVASGEILQGEEAVKKVVGYSLFWASQLSIWLTLPLMVAYKRVPFLYILLVGTFLPLYALIQAGGRSMFAVQLISFAMLVVGGRQRKTMHRIRRSFWLYSLLGIIAIYLGTAAYRFAATQGYMGDSQQQKYEKQSQLGDSPLSLLIGGRGGTFASLQAALDKPILGYGPWAIDTKGHYGAFLEKYGTKEDYDIYQRSAIKRGVIIIPAHSHIIGFWVWYGIFGLVLWLYVLRLYFVVLNRYLAVIPQWYGYLALSIPSAIWNILFSPFGARISACLIFIVCLFIRAVAEERICLPEAQKSSPWG